MLAGSRAIHGLQHLDGRTIPNEVLMIYIIREPATPEQIQAMLEALGTYRSMEILDPEIRDQVAGITRQLLGET